MTRSCSGNSRLLIKHRLTVELARAKRVGWRSYDEREENRENKMSGEFSLQVMKIRLVIASM